MDRRLRTLKVNSEPSTSSEIACPQGAIFLRLCGGSSFETGAGARALGIPTVADRWPRKSSVVTWSRFWSRCLILTPRLRTGKSAIDAVRQPVSAAGDTTGCSILMSKGYFDSIDWERLLGAVRR